MLLEGELKISLFATGSVSQALQIRDGKYFGDKSGSVCVPTVCCVLSVLQCTHDYPIVYLHNDLVDDISAAEIEVKCFIRILCFDGTVC